MGRRFIGAMLAGAVIVALVLGAAAIISSRKGGSKTGMEASQEEEIFYYTCGMHPSVKVSPEEYRKGTTQCPICSMNLVPVYKEKTVSKAAAPASVTSQGSKEIVYYRNPMNPSITSEVPMKDSMGMDYIPVYAQEASSASMVSGSDAILGCQSQGNCPHCDLGQADAECICGQHTFSVMKKEGITRCVICGKDLRPLSSQEVDQLKGVVSRIKIKGEQLELAGVATEELQTRKLYKEIRTVGRVAFDPVLAVAQQEYISAMEALAKAQTGTFEDVKERSGALVDAVRKKLLLMGLSQDQILELAQSRQVQDNFVLPQKKMWIYGDAYEFEISWVKQGQEVEVTTQALPGRIFNGVIASVNPVVDPKTRTFRFRAQVDNPNLELRPEMYVDIVVRAIFYTADGKMSVLALPKDALLDTGVRRIVWVDKGNGDFEGREVEIGPLASVSVGTGKREFYPVLRGLTEGEMVVTKANFLIDSQSQISGTAAAAYGGALGGDSSEEGSGGSAKSSVPSMSVHQH